MFGFSWAMETSEDVGVTFSVVKIEFLALSSSADTGVILSVTVIGLDAAGNVTYKQRETGI